MGASEEGRLFYVRLQGKVRGPFDEAKFRQLSQRGQLSRAHEVSIDGVQWRKAADFPELFRPPAAQREQGIAEQKVATGNADGSDLRSAPRPTTAVWYYAQDGTQVGPYDGTAIQQLIHTGQLRGDTLVWREGMTDWLPLHTVPDLASFIAGTVRTWEESGQLRERQMTRRLGDDVVRVLEDSQGWVLFNSVSSFVLAASFFGLAFGLLMNPDEANRINGLLCYVYAGTAGLFGLVVMFYYLGAGRAVHLRTEQALYTALRRLRTFWTLFGVLFVLAVVYTVYVIIGIFAR